MDKKEFLKKIKEIARQDTSFDPEKWTSENPLWGHCAVVSLLAQEIFGGELKKGSLKNYQKYSYLKSHIWNQINNEEIDFTKEQYKYLLYKNLEGILCTRDSILNHPDTIRRFDLLKNRLQEINTPI